MYRVIPAETQMQGKGTLAHVCQVLVELRVRIKSGKINQPKGERLPGTVKMGVGYLGPGGSTGCSLPVGQSLGHMVVISLPPPAKLRSWALHDQRELG